MEYVSNPLFFDEKQLALFEGTVWRYIKVRQAGFVLTVTLARPEKRNAFTPLMAEEIAYALAWGALSPEVRCVVLEAEGPVFCAGADLRAFHDTSVDGAGRSVPEPLRPVALGEAFACMDKPCIARVEGPVLAGGFLLVAGCTFVLSTPEATFGLPEVKRGLWPMQVMAALLPVMSRRKILEMCITGKNYTAAEALELGLVTALAGSEAMDAAVTELTGQICAAAPLAVRNGMRAMRLLPTINETDRHRWLQDMLAVLVASEDAREGVAAFTEKRTPVWKNR